MIFTIDDASTIPPEELPPAMQLWWGTYRGAPLGLMTDASGPLPLEINREVAAHLVHGHSVVGCVADDRLAAIAGVAPRDLGIGADEVIELDWGTGTVVVDGRPVATSTLTYRGLNFSLGADIERHPFVLVRLAGGRPEWPPLRTVSPSFP